MPPDSDEFHAESLDSKRERLADAMKAAGLDPVRADIAALPEDLLDHLLRVRGAGPKGYVW